MNVQHSSDRRSRGRRLAAPTSIKRGALRANDTVRHPPSENKRRTFQRQQTPRPPSTRIWPKAPDSASAKPSSIPRLRDLHCGLCPDNSSLQPASLPVTTRLGSIIAAFCTDPGAAGLYRLSCVRIEPSVYNNVWYAPTSHLILT
jgi:hypothetical protein